MNTEKVSVIVPIYNVESYLPECISSICSQTYKNIEIILVDDGSPDMCGRICDEFAKKDSRIVVIHKENGGLSDARNAGLMVAKGDLLCFVDSDDRLPDHSILVMYDLLKNNDAQMVIGGFERFHDGSGEVFFSTSSGGEKTDVMTREEALKDFYRDGCQAWAVLYSASVHRDIFFPVGEINEDEAIVFRILERCERVVVTNKVVYSYRCREDSITNSAFSVKKLAWYYHCHDNLIWMRENHPNLEDYATGRLCGAILWSLREIALSKENFEVEVTMLRKDIRENYNEYKSCNSLTKPNAIRLWLIRYIPFCTYSFLEKTYVALFH